MSEASSGNVSDMQALAEQLRLARLPEPQSGFDADLCARIRLLRDELVGGLQSAISLSDANRSAPLRQKPSLPRASSLMKSSPRPAATQAASIVPKAVARPLPNPRKRAATVPEPIPPSVSEAIAVSSTPWKHRQPAVDIAAAPTVVDPARRPDRSEIVLAVRWWNAPIALAAGLFVAGVLVWYAADSLRAGVAMASLDAELACSEPNADLVRSLCGIATDSPSARFDACRDYLLARATARFGRADDPSVRDAVALHLRRAQSKSPAMGWYRLSLASWSKENPPDGDRAVLERLSQSEPAALEAFAAILDRAGQRTESRDALRRSLALDPSRAAVVVQRLVECRVPIAEAMDIVPDHPVALLELTKIAKPWNENVLRTQIEVKLTQFEGRAPNREPDRTSFESTSGRQKELWAAVDSLRDWLADADGGRHSQRINAN